MKNKRVLFSEKGKVEFAETDFNEKIESPDEVIIKTLFSQISPGSELACLAGLEDWFKIPGTPGYTAVGEIIEKGSNVTFNIGDKVFTFGPHAQYFKINITDRWHGLCVKLPDGLPGDIASFTHLTDIAISALRVSNIQLGDYVGVTGMGPIGNLAAQLAKLQGAQVIVLDINESRLQIARKCGLTNTINSSSPEVKDELMKMTSGKGVSTLVEASGMAQVAESAMKYISQYGEMILLGTPRAPYQTNLTEYLRDVHLFYPSITVKGALEFIIPTQSIEFVKHSKERDCSIIMQLLKEERIIVKPFYTHKVRPDKAPEMYAGLQNKKDEFIGVVFDWLKIF
jgi:2-desacetyl-2-hydroxyethyl bacteriochlorophyllide A dehydrogenase